MVWKALERIWVVVGGKEGLVLCSGNEVELLSNVRYEESLLRFKVGEGGKLVHVLHLHA